MSRKIYNKLIRDKIPEIIKSKGKVPKVSVLTEEKYRKALKEKMGEEVKELLEAKTNNDILNELADIQELIKAIAKNHRITIKAVENKRKKKKRERGSFKKKIFLKYID